MAQKPSSPPRSPRSAPGRPSRPSNRGPGGPRRPRFAAPAAPEKPAQPELPRPQLVAKLQEVIDVEVTRQGCRLVAAELLGSPQGKRVLRVSVDKGVPGQATLGEATLEELIRTSRALSPILDAEDLIQTAYDLEVSSPGMERPVQKEADFLYFVGCTIRLKTFGMDARRRVRGVIRGIEEGRLQLETSEGVQFFTLADIERAHLVLDLDQYARIGQGLHPLASAQGDSK